MCFCSGRWIISAIANAPRRTGSLLDGIDVEDLGRMQCGNHASRYFSTEFACACTVRRCDGRTAQNLGERCRCICNTKSSRLSRENSSSGMIDFGRHHRGSHPILVEHERPKALWDCVLRIGVPRLMCSSCQVRSEGLEGLERFEDQNSRNKSLCVVH